MSEVRVTVAGTPVPGAAVLALSEDAGAVAARGVTRADGTVAIAAAGGPLLARAHGPEFGGSASGTGPEFDLAAAAPLWPVTIRLEDAQGGDVPRVMIRLMPMAAPHIPQAAQRWLLDDDGARLISYVELPCEGAHATIALQEPGWLVAADGRAIARAHSPRGQEQWVTVAARLPDGTELAGDFTGFELPVAGPAEVVLVLEARRRG